ncbi:hypothetical protein JCM10213_002808 [Rhodosporidiobolus nylandii]
MQPAQVPPRDDADPPLAPPPSYNAAIASPLIPSSTPGPSSSSSLAAHPAFQHKHAHLGLPSGFFLLRNRAQGKTLDLLHHKTHEGAEFGLHPVKSPSLRGVSLQHNANNQLFFLDWEGQLVAAAASREVDVVDAQLSLAYPHPITTFPSQPSHPLPRFRLDPVTHTLHVLFSSDPLYRGPHAPPDWRDEDYVLEAVPRKRRPQDARRTAPAALLGELGSKAGDVLSGLGGGLGEKLGGFFGGRLEPSSTGPVRKEHELPLPPPPVPDKALTPSPSSPSAPIASTSTPATAPLPSALTHPVPQLLAEDDSDSDSEPAAYRPVRVVRLPRRWRDKFPASALRASPSTSFGVTQWPASSKELRTWRRRQWEVVPVTVQPVPAKEWLVSSPSGSLDSSRSPSEADYDSEDEAEAIARAPPLPSSSAGPGPMLSSLSSAASSAQTHAVSAATALSGMLSSAFTPRAGDEDGDSGEDGPSLPELPSASPSAASGTQPRDAEGEWDDAAELKEKEIEGLGISDAPTKEAEQAVEEQQAGEADSVVVALPEGWEREVDDEGKQAK